MKLYRAAIYDKDGGTILSWFSNRAEAERWVKTEQPTPAHGPFGVEPVEVPTDRAGLLGWLNANMTTDNG